MRKVRAWPAQYCWATRQCLLLLPCTPFWRSTALSRAAGRASPEPWVVAQRLAAPPTTTRASGWALLCMLETCCLMRATRTKVCQPLIRLHTMCSAAACRQSWRAPAGAAARAGTWQARRQCPMHAEQEQPLQPPASCTFPLAGRVHAGHVCKVSGRVEISETWLGAGCSGGAVPAAPAQARRQQPP